MFMHPFYTAEDRVTAEKTPFVSFLHPEMQKADRKCLSACTVFMPDETTKFLHEAAIAEYRGVLYASWYNCPVKELQGYTPICGKCSTDGGKTWSDLEILCEDRSGKILYCPPVYAVAEDRLYMFVNQMVAPDHIHSLDLYILNNETGSFELLWSRPVPFKLNTNAVALPNGKLLLPGRVGELDGFPNTPAVLISDSGRADDEWRLVKIAENGDLADGKKLVHPEISVILAEGKLWMFCRNDESRIPLVYISEDMGESWSAVHAHDIPYVNSKIYCGELSDGRHYLVCNTERFDRSKLMLYVTEGEKLCFTKELLVFDAAQKETRGAAEETSYACHYPGCWEYDGKLYIIATVSYADNVRGADLFTVDLREL